MKLYLVTRTDPVNWEQFQSALIRAQDENHARELAGAWPALRAPDGDKGGDFDPSGILPDGSNLEVVRITEEGGAGRIIQSTLRG